MEILRENAQVFIVCRARDMGDSKPLKGIHANEWNEYKENVKVYYAKKFELRAIQTAFRYCNPDVVYINGMFLPVFSWFPLWMAKTQNRKVVMAPRGMLQKGALAIRTFKKKTFLYFFKWLGAHKGVIWHATDYQEREDIRTIFGSSAFVLMANVIVAHDIPKKPMTEVRRPKRTNQLRIIYLSLITEKKNLHIVLQALRMIKTPIEFDIYGPIKDGAYWKKCKHLMEGQVHQIQYRGPINPNDVQQTLSAYHAFVFPTKGENFGHAIYEALSVGTPAIISSFTPWGQLQPLHAGITVCSEGIEAWATAVQSFLYLDQTEFDYLSAGAFNLASKYFLESDFKSSYAKIFFN